MGKKYCTSFGGDERNPYVRRYKSPSNPPKASSSNANLPERKSESESSNRPKYSGNIVKHNYQGTGKYNPKSKLRSPVKVGLGQSTNRINRSSFFNTNKEVKNNSDTIQSDSEITKMKTETENSDKKQKPSNVPSENKESSEQIDNNKQISEPNHTNEQSLDQQENGNANGLNKKEAPLEESSNDNKIKDDKKQEQNEKVSQTNEKEEEEFNLHLEAEENCLKTEEESKESSGLNEDNKQDEIKVAVQEQDTQPNAESCSVDVVESTTSETTEAAESTAPSETKEKSSENQETNNDAISYDSSIMLKDVKIKLNDCLKDSKIGEESNVEQSLPTYMHKTDTFGKTLRTISGRNSIGRMRHVTLRDRQPSPNSSLFVNTSNVSLSEDSSDCRILRHRSALLELTSSNGGTPIDRKRKLVIESPDVLKKSKTENTSLFNASFELLKYPFSPRRPVKVSTPYKFQSEKHNLGIDKEIKAEESRDVKKWCIIM